MTNSVRQPKILMIGGDLALTYLIERYSEQSGVRIATTPDLPSAEEVLRAKPAVVLFASLAVLEEAQGLLAALAGSEIPVLACTSVADEARARELGADHCLLHPLTHDGFLEAFKALVKPGAPQS